MEKPLLPMTPEGIGSLGRLAAISGAPLIGSCHVGDSMLVGKQLLIHFNSTQRIFRVLPGETYSS